MSLVQSSPPAQAQKQRQQKAPGKRHPCVWDKPRGTAVTRVLSRTASYLESDKLHYLRFEGIPTRVAVAAMDILYHLQEGYSTRYNRIFDLVPRDTLESFRFDYIPSLSLLTIRNMSDNIRDAIISLVRHMYIQLLPEQTGFTLEEVKDILVIHQGGVNLPGITRLRTTPACSKRTRQPAYRKTPDIYLKHGLQREFPHVVFEVGFAREKQHQRKYQEGIEDARDWLCTSGGMVKVVWVVQIVEGPLVEGRNQAFVDALIEDEKAEDDIDGHDGDGIETTMYDGDYEDDHSRPASSQSSINITNQSGLDAIVPTLSSWIGPFTVFFEGYTYKDQDITLSYPRQYLLTNGIPTDPLPTLPLSRHHFNLDGEGELSLSWERYLEVLEFERQNEGFWRKIRAERSARKAAKRKRDAEWVPGGEADDDSGEEGTPDRKRRRAC